MKEGALIYRKVARLELKISKSSISRRYLLLFKIILLYMHAVEFVGWAPYHAADLVGRLPYGGMSCVYWVQFWWASILHGFVLGLKFLDVNNNILFFQILSLSSKLAIHKYCKHPFLSLYLSLSWNSISIEMPKLCFKLRCNYRYIKRFESLSLKFIII